MDSPALPPRGERCQRQADKPKRRFRKTPCLLRGEKRVAGGGVGSVGGPDEIKRRDSSGVDSSDRSGRRSLRRGRRAGACSGGGAASVLSPQPNAARSVAFVAPVSTPRLPKARTTAPTDLGVGEWRETTTIGSLATGPRANRDRGEDGLGGRFAGIVR